MRSADTSLEGRGCRFSSANMTFLYTVRHGSTA
jgi:hypothetical protein